ncbi:MAG: nuclease, partial [Sphingobacteriales bacterium]
MSFEGEFASYEPLRRLLDSDKVKALQSRFVIRKKSEEDENFELNILSKESLQPSQYQPDLIVAVDGSNLIAKAENGFPGAEFGYITIASVLIDLVKVKECASEEFISPKKLRETEKAS